MNEMKPYSKQLKNEDALKLIYFEAKSLNDFIYDPRYEIINFIHRCNISISNEYYHDDSFEDKNKIVLDNIGFGYDENDERIIGIFLKNLSKLSPQIQQRFKTYEIHKNVYLDSLFINSINGKWSKPSIFQVINYEIEKINEIINDDEKLFLNEFKNNSPREFNIIILPTQNEYNSFITTFDKILSDNLNKEFFRGKVELNKKTSKNELHKGTISLLKEWLEKINVNKETITKIINPIKEVRNQRNKPSHSIYTDKYDVNFIVKQNDILLEIYHSLRFLINELKKYYNSTVSLDKWFINNKIVTHTPKDIKIDKNKNYQLNGIN